MLEYYFDNRIYYRRNEFRPGRATLMFIHGLSGNSFAWKPYEKLLEGKYNLVAFDLRGHGASVKLKRYNDYRPDRFCQDLRSLALSLGISSFILVSHSYGGCIALEFLDRYPEMAAGAIFLSPNYCIKKMLRSRLMRPVFAIGRMFAFLPVGSAKACHVDYSRYRNTGDWNLRRIWADVLCTSLKVCIYSFKQANEICLEAILGRVRVPVAIVHGKKDSVFPLERSLEMARKIKNARIKILAKADHILVLNNVDEVCQEIDDFSAQVWKRA